jgi:hypothetical protein
MCGRGWLRQGCGGVPRQLPGVLAGGRRCGLYGQVRRQGSNGDPSMCPHLIARERYERADDHGKTSVPCQRRQLEAQRLASAGGEDGEQVLALQPAISAQGGVGGEDRLAAPGSHEG